MITKENRHLISNKRKARPSTITNPRIVAKMAQIPSNYVSLFERAQTSRPAAVKFHCLECVGFVRAEVTLCSSPGCALYNHRPYRGKKDGKVL